MIHARSLRPIGRSLAAVLLVFAVGACGGDDDEAAPTTTTTTTEVTASPAAFCEAIGTLADPESDAPALWQQAVDVAPPDISAATAELVELMELAVDDQDTGGDPSFGVEQAIAFDERLDEVFGYVDEHCPDPPSR